MGETEVGIIDSKFLGSCRLLSTIHSGFLPDSSSTKEEHFVWSFACEHNFETLKDRLTLALIPSLPGGHENFIAYNNASGIRLGYVLMRGRVITYAP